jgi:hypothetical protein
MKLLKLSALILSVVALSATAHAKKAGPIQPVLDPVSAVPGQMARQCLYVQNFPNALDNGVQYALPFTRITNLCPEVVSAAWKWRRADGQVMTYAFEFEPLRANPDYKKKDKCNGWTCHPDPHRKPYFTDEKVFTWEFSNESPDVYACAAPAKPESLGDQFSCVVPNGYHPELAK